MASTFVNNLRLEEMATGEQSGNWGTKTNTNLELIGEALGFGTEAITTNANTHTTTVADASSDAGRAMFIKYTGALDSDCTITIGPNTMKRVHIIENATTDSGSSGPYNIIISQGSGANVTIANGTAKVVYLDGAGSGAAVVDAFAHLAAVDLTVDDDLIVSDNITLKSDSAVLGFGADTDTTLTHTDGTGLTLNSTNKLTFGDAASFVQQSADGTLRIDGEAIIDLNASTRVDVSTDLQVGDDLSLASDGAVLNFGADSDVNLTHVADSALLLNDAIKMTFRDSALSVSSSTDGQLDVDADTEVEITAPTIDLTASTKVTVSNDVEVTGRSVGVTVTAENDGSFDLAVGNDFTCTTSGNTEITFSNAKAGQSGNIKFVNASNHTITANALVAINADVLTTISSSGTYHLAYYVTADSGNDTILVSASAALT
tara:strand:- start:14218 stop:15513 length:1296 start_codon:yes stop_codon:yes gene_type:complete